MESRIIWIEQCEATRGIEAQFGIKSPFGISQAVIQREAERWPDTVVLRLHLKGLESFRASNGKVTVDAAVSNRAGQVKVRKYQDMELTEVLPR
jgi:hypothetical protein